MAQVLRAGRGCGRCVSRRRGRSARTRHGPRAVTTAARCLSELAAMVVVAAAAAAATAADTIRGRHLLRARELPPRGPPVSPPSPGIHSCGSHDSCCRPRRRCRSPRRLTMLSGMRGPSRAHTRTRTHALAHTHTPAANAVIAPPAAVPASSLAACSRARLHPWIAAWRQAHTEAR